MLSLLRSRVQPLIRELRFRKPRSATKKKKKELLTRCKAVNPLTERVKIKLMDPEGSSWRKQPLPRGLRGKGKKLERLNLRNSDEGPNRAETQTFAVCLVLRTFGGFFGFEQQLIPGYNLCVLL